MKKDPNSLDDTLCNIGRRMYFDPPRSRLFEYIEPKAGGFVIERCYDMSLFWSKRAARLWCESEGIEFIDTQLGRHRLDLQGCLMAARKAGSPRAENIGRYRPQGEPLNLSWGFAYEPGESPCEKWDAKSPAEKKAELDAQWQQYEREHPNLGRYGRNRA